MKPGNGNELGRTTPRIVRQIVSSLRQT